MYLIKPKQMRRTIVVNIILIFFLAGIAGQTPEERYAQAGELYSSGDYSGAAAIYRQLYDDGYRSEDLLYNAGNAFYKIYRQFKMYNDPTMNPCLYGGGKR